MMSVSASENITSNDSINDNSEFDNVEITCDANSYIEYGRNVTFEAKNLPNDFKGSFVVKEHMGEEADLPGSGYYENIASSPIINSSARIVLSNLTFGSHSYYSEVLDSNNSSVAHSRLGFNVFPYINGNVSPYYDNEFQPITGNVTLSIELPSDANDAGYIWERITNTTQKINFTNGKASLHISNLTFGEYVYILTYNDSRYQIEHFIAALYASPKITYPAYMMAGDDEYLLFEGPNDANGTLHILNTTKTLENGKANVSLSSLPLGFSYLNLTYVDDKYGNFTYDKYLGIRVCNQTPTIDIIRIDNTLIIKLNENIPDAYGEVIIDGETTEIYFENSEATVPYDYFITNVTARFSGSGLYMPTSVSKLNPFTPTADQIHYEEGDIAIPVGLNENIKGNLLVKVENVGNFTFEITGNTTNITIPNMTAGEYNVSITYAGNDEFFTSTHTIPIIVKEYIPPYIFNPKIIAKDVSAIYTSSAKITATTYMSDAEIGVEGVSVTFKVNGKKCKTVPTDSKGQASITLKKAPGTYNIKIEALGIAVNKKLTVKHLVTLKKANVKKSAKKLILQATLGKVNGKYLKGKPVTFKFNGKTYKTKTNSKGVAKITIKSQVLKKLKAGKKVTYQATYLKDTVKKTVKVKK